MDCNLVCLYLCLVHSPKNACSQKRKRGAQLLTLGPNRFPTKFHPLFHLTGCQPHRQPDDLAVGGESSREEPDGASTTLRQEQGSTRVQRLNCAVAGARSQEAGGGKVLSTVTIRTAASHTSIRTSPRRLHSVSFCEDQIPAAMRS